MQGTTILSLLALRVEDVTHERFPSSLKLNVINNAQLRLINMLDDDYFNEIQATSIETPAADAVDLSTLDPIIVRDRIFKVKDTASGDFYHLKTIKELKKLENSFFTPSANYRIAYKFAGQVHFEPSPGSTVSVWYLRKPVDIADTSVEQELNEVLVPILLDIAEASLWRMDNQTKRASDAMQSAFNEVQVLNTRVGVETPRPVEIGKRSE